MSSAFLAAFCATAKNPVAKTMSVIIIFFIVLFLYVL
jgi:hypothetical protein